METNFSQDLPQKDVSAQEPKEAVRETHHYHYKDKKTNAGSVFIGLILIMAGFIYLADTLGFLDIKLDLLKFWPVLIIFAGLSIMSSRSWISLLVGIFMALAVMFVVFWTLFSDNFFGMPAMMPARTVEKDIKIQKESGIERTAVEIRNVIGNLDIKGGTSSLVKGSFKSNFQDITVENYIDGKTQEVVISGSEKLRSIRAQENSLALELDKELPSDLYIKTGAANIGLDLRDLRMEKTSIDAGASKIRVRIGDKAVESELFIKAGASSVEIILPRGIGAKMSLKTGLTSKELNNFRQTGDNTYESEDYEKAGKKINIILDVGISSLKVDWE